MNGLEGIYRQQFHKYFLPAALCQNAARPLGDRTFRKKEAPPEDHPGCAKANAEPTR